MVKATQKRTFTFSQPKPKGNALKPNNTRLPRAFLSLLATLAMLLGLGLTSVTVATSARADSSTAANTAVTWAEARLGQDIYDGLCLEFVSDAYASAGITIGSSDTAVTYWNSHTSGGTDTNPPVGALVFWGATTTSMGYGLVNNPDGHVALSIGGGNVISSYERSDHTIHEFSIATRNAAHYPYLGWMMPPGVTAPSGGTVTPPPPPADSDGDGVIDTQDTCPAVKGSVNNRGCPLDGHTVTGNFSGNDSYTDTITFYDLGSNNVGAFLSTGSSAGLSQPQLLWTTGTGQWSWGNSTFVAGNFSGNDQYTDVIALYNYGDGRLGAWLFPGSSIGIGQGQLLWETSANSFSMSSAHFFAGKFTGSSTHDDIEALYNYGNGQLGQFLLVGNGSGVNQPQGEWSTATGVWNMTSAQYVVGNFSGGDSYADIVAFFGYDNGSISEYVLPGSASGVGQPQGSWNTGPGSWHLAQSTFVAGNFSGNDGNTDVMAFYDYGGANMGANLLVGNGSGVNQPQGLWNTGAGNFSEPNAKFFAGNFSGSPSGASSIFEYYNYGSSRTGGGLMSPLVNGGVGMPSGGWATGTGQWNWLCM